MNEYMVSWYDRNVEQTQRLYFHGDNAEAEAFAAYAAINEANSVTRLRLWGEIDPT